MNSDNIRDLLQLGLAVVFFIVSYFVGRRNEQAHFADIIRREKALATLPAGTLRTLEERPVAQSKMVLGNIVIAGDFFKMVVASLASVFGLRIAVAESLMDRARREAVLRMKEQAQDADAIVNVRFETMKLGNREKISGVEMLAYGTAIYYVK